jgi:hypothetical protein
MARERFCYAPESFRDFLSALGIQAAHEEKSSGFSGPASGDQGARNLIQLHTMVI